MRCEKVVKRKSRFYHKIFHSLCTVCLFVVAGLPASYIREAGFEHLICCERRALDRLRCGLAVLYVDAGLGAVATSSRGQDRSDYRAMRIIRLKLTGVKNFGEVTPILYRGAQASPEGLGNLKEMGIQIIVDLRGRNHGDERRVEGLGMQYVPIGGTCFPQRDSKYAQFLAVVDKSPGKKIFVECRLGDDRTGMAVAPFRMANQDWSAQEAMEEMRAFGFAKIHHIMCPFLARYENHFPQRYATSGAFADERKSYPPGASRSIASKQ